MADYFIAIMFCRVPSTTVITILLGTRPATPEERWTPTTEMSGSTSSAVVPESSRGGWAISETGVVILGVFFGLTTVVVVLIAICCRWRGSKGRRGRKGEQGEQEIVSLRLQTGISRIGGSQTGPSVQFERCRPDQ